MTSSEDIRAGAGDASSPVNARRFRVSDVPPVYVIEFCPECKGQILGQSQWHRADCPNIDKVFAIHQVIGVPLDAVLQLLRAPERQGRSYGSYALAANLLEAEFGPGLSSKKDQP